MQNRFFSLLLASTFVFGAAIAGPLEAKTCRDAAGKFMKCTAPAPVAPAKCRDAAGKFTKCDTPDAKPAQ